MKKTLLLVFFASCISAAHSQTFGIQAGATFPSFKAEVSGDSKTSKTKVGFTVGVISHIPIGSSLSFQPSLNFTQKGGKDEESFEGISESEKVTLNYLELPLNVVYNTSSDAGQFFIGAGPSIGMGLSSKSKFEAGGESGEEDIKFGSDKDLKPLDFGVNFLAGYKLENGVFIAANYTAGLSNLSTDNDGKFHNHYFGIRVGFLFGGKAK